MMRAVVWDDGSRLCRRGFPKSRKAFRIAHTREVKRKDPKKGGTEINKKGRKGDWYRRA
jgi:hypothetical protein